MLKQYTNNQIALMEKQIKEHGILIEEVDKINNAFLVKKESLISWIPFQDFKEYLYIFLSNINIILGTGEIAFNTEELKNGILNPYCTCGNNNIACDYEGETTENYYYNCTNCGAARIVDGYVLDTLI